MTEAEGRTDPAGDTPPVWLTQLTPLVFLERTAEVFGDRIGIVDGDRRITYRQFAASATRLANALTSPAMGEAVVRPGDRVAYLVGNRAEMLIGHFAVPLAGGVLVALNTRLATAEIQGICDHSGSTVLVVESTLFDAIVPVLDQLQTVTSIVVIDPQPGQTDHPMVTDYDTLLAAGSDDPLRWTVADENATISINYTSGTTGSPKGVMYSHRGAYLNALGEVISSGFDASSVYLWTLPMFHCNGWCTPWGVTAVAARHVCLPAVRGEHMWQLITAEGVTHLNGSPPVATALVEAPAATPDAGPLTLTIAAAPPSPTLIEKLDALGVRVVHVYGLTETYGPYTICEWQDGWPALPPAERAAQLARQGVGMLQADRVRVVDERLRDVPADATTVGEVVMRGNNVMTGYYRDPEATAKAFRGGWFHSGDLGVMHPDGYIQLVDRAKDIVISGGENISTIEVEQVLLTHPDVIDAAVVGVPDERWGERPRAFVVLGRAGRASEAELIEHVRGRIARFKAPREVVFVDALPRTSTGKIQKFALRAATDADRP